MHIQASIRETGVASHLFYISGRLHTVGGSLATVIVPCEFAGMLYVGGRHVGFFYDWMTRQRLRTTVYLLAKGERT